MHSKHFLPMVPTQAFAINGYGLTILEADVAGYLTFEHGRGSRPICGFAQGCEVVSRRVYAHLWGLPTAAYGLADLRAALRSARGVHVVLVAFPWSGGYNVSMDDPHLKELASQATEPAHAALKQAIAQIEGLAQSVDAVQLFVATVANMAFAPEGSISEATHGDVPAKIEALAYHLYPFFQISGKEVSSKPEITPLQINECIESLGTIVTMRLIRSAFSDGAKTESNEANSIATLARMQAEIVRGSAYPEQTGMEISSVQGHFYSWFVKTVGISPSRAKDLLWAIRRHHESAFNSAMPEVRARAKAARKHWRSVEEKPASQRDGDETRALEIFENAKAAGLFAGDMALNLMAPQVIPVGRSDLSDLEPPPTIEEWDGLSNLIGMSTDVRSQMSAPVDVRMRPLFVLPDNRAILVDITNCLDVLWEAFEQLATVDQKFYQKYQRRKANWLEDMVIACLSTIFPSQNIYRNLLYPDPDKTDGSTAELDAAVLWGPFLVLVESKAKQFRLESQLGDIGRLRTDIKANVEDAFVQARRAAKYIKNTAAPIFAERSTGRQLAVQKDLIRRTYLVTVSQHHLAGLATRLSIFQGLGLFRDAEYPFSVSVADLEIITQFCEGPDVFLHYIENRLLTQKESLDIQADELDLWGAYLQTRLQPTRLWERDGVRPHGIWLAGFSARFDDWYSYKRGDLSTPPNIGLEIPTEIKNVLSGLRRRNDDAARWIAFALLDLSDRVLEVIAKGLADLKTARLTPGMFRRMVYTESGTVISIVASHDLPRALLQDRTLMRAMIEKYVHKAEKSIAFGVMTTDLPQPFDCALWIDGTWHHDADMEELITNEPATVPAPGTRLPGRNAPCACGSGKKYKKCCLPRFEAGQRKMSNTSLQNDIRPAASLASGALASRGDSCQPRARGGSRR